MWCYDNGVSSQDTIEIGFCTSPIDMPQDTYREYIKSFDKFLVPYVRRGEKLAVKPEDNSTRADQQSAKVVIRVRKNGDKSDNKGTGIETSVVSPKVPTMAIAARGKLRQHSLTMENLWQLSDKAATYQKLSRYGLFGGTGIGLLGFILWYIYVQRHQDKLIRLQVRKETSGSARDT